MSLVEIPIFPIFPKILITPNNKKPMANSKKNSGHTTAIFAFVVFRLLNLKLCSEEVFVA